MKRLLISVVSAIVLLGSTAVLADTSKTFDDGVTLTCKDTNAYEYVCYSDAECQEFLSGYAAVVKERFMAQRHGWFKQESPIQVIHVNLFAEHTGLYLIGRMEAENKEGKVFLKYWGIVCDIELNVGTSFYKEGFSNAKITQ
jgi:hypothetical protein